MDIFVGLGLLILGLCVGSFLNCVVYRLNHNLSPLKGRSICPKCKHQLAWRDNLPLLSFILLRGKCRYCRSPISWQYPLVELAAGVLTLLIFNFRAAGIAFGDARQFPIFQLIFSLLITYCLLAIFVSDLLYQTIPDQVIIFALGFSLIFWRFNLLAGLGAAGFFLLLVLVTRGRGMGLGDVKLAGLMGLVLGWPKIAIALFLAFLTGALAGVILILLGKKRLGQHISFGPFLVAATLISLFWGGLIWQWYLVKIAG